MSHFYFTAGVPEANRVLLDVWIADISLPTVGWGIGIDRCRALAERDLLRKSPMFALGRWRYSLRNPA